jgi:DNA polymerase
VTPGEGSREERWQTLSQQILEDPWCLSQVKPGKKLVPGTGSLEADIFFCGEAPGAEEQVHGEPFVGPAGQLLTRIIRAMGLSREDVFIGNIMTYRPPMPSPVGNRPPSVDELTYCLPYLKAQLALVQPKVIVGLGKTALDGLLGPDTKRRMTRIRGQWQAFEGIPLMPTFHPSYLLRNQSLATKRQVWEDMLAVMERIGLPISEKQRGFFLKDQG